MLNFAGQDRSDYGASATIHAFRVALTPRHRGYLARWLAAGQRMGLHDVQICEVDDDGHPTLPHVVIWVRENADPAYVVAPEGMQWKVVDCIRSNMLARFANFEAALNFIRPVLAVDVAA